MLGIPLNSLKRGFPTWNILPLAYTIHGPCVCAYNSFSLILESKGRKIPSSKNQTIHIQALPLFVLPAYIILLLLSVLGDEWNKTSSEYIPVRSTAFVKDGF